MFEAKAVPMICNGLGSIFAIHFSSKPIQRISDISDGNRALRPLLHMEMLLEGVLVCGRGDLFLSLPMTDVHLSSVHLALEKFVDRYKHLIIEVLDKT